MDKIEQAIKNHMGSVGNLLAVLGDEHRYVSAQEAVEQSARDLVALVAAHEREQCALSVESLAAKYPSIEEWEDTGACIAWEPSGKYDNQWIDQTTAAAAIRARGTP